MELEKFIEESLKQIIQGVKNAQAGTRLPDKNLRDYAFVNPHILYTANNAPKGKYYTTYDSLVLFVDFDVAVTTDYKEEAKGSFGIKVFGIGLGAGGSAEEGESKVSRIKFQIPLRLPKADE